MTIEATWVLELNCECPGCGEYVNLADECEFWCDNRIEAAEHNTERSNNLEVCCPDCGHEFTVKCIW